MIVDRYDPVNLFELVPKLKVEMEPELAGLDVLLDDDELFSLVRADLIQRWIPTRGGSGAIFHARRGNPEDARRQEALWVELRTDRALRLRFDRSEAVLPYLPRARPRRHHPDQVGEPDRLRDGRIAQPACRRTSQELEGYPWEEA